MINPKMQTQPEYWIQQHYDYLFGYARARVPENVSEDLVQETYLSGLKAMESFRFKSKERTWLTSILRHKIIDYYRKANTKKGLVKERLLKESDFEEKYGFCWSAAIVDEQAADDTLNAKELKRIIQKGLSELTPLERKVIVHKMNGLTTSEICLALQIGCNNCWVHLSKARRKLRVHIALHWDYH